MTTASMRHTGPPIAATRRASGPTACWTAPCSGARSRGKTPLRAGPRFRPASTSGASTAAHWRNGTSPTNLLYRRRRYAARRTSSVPRRRRQPLVAVVDVTVPVSRGQHSARSCAPAGSGTCSPGGCVVGGVHAGNLSDRYRGLVAGGEVHSLQLAGAAVSQQMLTGRVHGDGVHGKAAAAVAQLAYQPDPLAGRS